MKITDEIHKNNPKVGDYWHEMFSPYHVVVDVNKFYVAVCDSTKRVNNSSWTWDTSKPLKFYTRDEYYNLHKYGTQDGWPCSVVPEGHKWVSEEIGSKNIKKQWFKIIS